MFIWHPSDLDVKIFLDTWRREKANHIQCHSTAAWCHFESLEQFQEEALPKPPMQYMGLWVQKKGMTKMDSLEFYMDIWMGRLGIIPKGMLDALHPYLSPNLSSLQQGYEEEQREIDPRLPLWIFRAVPEGRFVIACLKLPSKMSLWSELLVPSM
ncbi:hypothetical protein AAG906_022093 [Vitis piasezkii]